MAADREITVIALGGAGCRIMSMLAGVEAARKFNLLAIDSDTESLKSSGLPEDKQIQVGKLLRSGRGCGGDIISGQQALANERKMLANLLSDTRILVVIAGLGGGLATGGLPVILGVAAKLHIAMAAVVTLPFSLEGFQRRHLADEKIKNDLLPLADAVLALPNDLLFSTLNAETPIAEAFRLSDQEVSRTVLALISIFGGGNLFSADFASFTGILKRRHTLCPIGTALVDNNEDAAAEAMDKMLASPLLGGPESLDNADALAFSLLGGPELSIGNARTILDLCSRQIDQESGKTLLLGASTADEFAGKIQLTVMAVRYLDRNEPLRDKSGKQSGHHDVRGGNGGDAGMQMTLPLVMEDKGIMENTTPIMLDGEDLDVPTFRRRGLVIDTGK
jgi:cell division protein FtsZ